MSYKPNYVNGAWKADCDRCGRTYKNYELKLEWDNLRVCQDCWEIRQPQDFVRAVADIQSPAWTRPEGSNIFIDSIGVTNFSATPLTGTAPLSVTFTDTSTNSPTAWNWNFGEEFSPPSYIQNPTFIYTVPGIYTVFLMTTNASGSNTEQKTNYITVTES